MLNIKNYNIRLKNYKMHSCVKKLVIICQKMQEVLQMNDVKKQNFFDKSLPKAVASAGLGFAKAGANSGCCLIFHQPKKPDMKKLRKF